MISLLGLGFLGFRMPSGIPTHAAIRVEMPASWMCSSVNSITCWRLALMKCRKFMRIPSYWLVTVLWAYLLAFLPAYFLESRRLLCRRGPMGAGYARILLREGSRSRGRTPARQCDPLTAGLREGRGCQTRLPCACAVEERETLFVFPSG